MKIKQEELQKTLLAQFIQTPRNLDSAKLSLSLLTNSSCTLLGPKQSFLSVLIQTFSQSKTDTQDLPNLVQFFLANNFNTTLFGVECLNALVASTYDDTLLQSAHLFFDKGITLSMPKQALLLDAIYTEEAYQSVITANHACENIFYAYYELVASYNLLSKQIVPIYSYLSALNNPILDIKLSSPNTQDDTLIAKHIIIRLPIGDLIIQDKPNIFLAPTSYASIHHNHFASHALKPDFDNQAALLTLEDAKLLKLRSQLKNQTITNITFTDTLITHTDSKKYHLPTIIITTTNFTLTIGKSQNLQNLTLTLN